MSLFSNIFGQSTAPAAAVATTTPAAPNPPNPAATNATPVEPASPMDQFNDLWQPATTQTGVDATLPSNMFAGTDPAKMLESARKVDFAKQIPPEVLAKITSGGPDAAAAFAQAINDVGQRSYAQSSFAATKIVEAALAKFQEGLDARLPSQVKNFQVRETLRDSNPALTHPAAAPIMEALQAQLTVKYPNASVKELQDMSSQYLAAFTGIVSPKPKADAVPESENWDKFFS